MQPASSADPRPAVPRALVVVLFLGTLVAALDIALIGPTLGAINDAFGVSTRLSAWVLSAFVLTNLIGLPFTSWMGDAYGRRRVFIGCLMVFATGTIIVALAPAFPALLAGRVVQGLGASGLFPMASAVVGDVFPPERRGRVLGLLGAVFGVAFLIGPIMAGILVRYSWRWVFLATLPLSLGVLAAALRVLPRDYVRQRKPLDWPGALLLGAGLLPLALAASQVETTEPGARIFSAPTLLLLASAAVAFVALAWVERRAKAPLLSRDLLVRRQVRLAALFCVGAGLSEAVIIFLPPFAQAAFGVSRPQASYMLLPLVFAITLGSPVAGRLLDRLGSRVVLRGGAGVLAAGFTVLSLGPATLATYYAGTVLMGLGLSGLLGSSLSYILLNEAAAHERSVAQGLVTLFLSTGQIVGAALIGALVASGAGSLIGFREAFGLAAIAAAGLVVAGFGLKRRDAEVARR